FFTPDMTLHANRIFSMEQDLRLAIQHNQFILDYQPQVDLASGRVCGVEALIRWKHPKMGLVMPDDFIAVAEETGQILAIGLWVLRTACVQLATWRAQGLPLFPVSVNLSLRQLRQTSLAQEIAAVLKETGLGPGDLELELTEGVTMGDTQMAMAFLLQMRQLGVLLSIDDFGTGYSSLNYLKKLPVDKLKIDQSFVSDIHEGNDAAIVRSIISLGHQFNLEVIAEGVETLEQLDFLHARGCDQIQGYYFSQPLPPDEFMAFARSNPSLGYSSSRLNRRKISFPNTLRSAAFIERRVAKALPFYGMANNAV
ncbi:MAG: EAL domain-containing protein, partial [Gallionellaceae bacterium]|nr:EAL domain-containing protein [Gallionellaceae bacterium]